MRERRHHGDRHSVEDADGAADPSCLRPITHLIMASSAHGVGRGQGVEKKLPNGALQIVARWVKKDGAPDEV